MRVRLALVGCAAFCLGVPPMVAATPPALPGDVSLAAAAQASTAVPQSMTTKRKRYTLTMTYTADLESGGPNQSCGWGSPIYPATGLVWVCSSDYDDRHEVRSYGAKSVRPFTFKRIGKYYSFETRMKGTSQQVGNYWGWSHWWIGGQGYSDATVSGVLKSTGKVTGKVYLNGATPARLINEMTAAEDKSGTDTVYQCSDGACGTSTYPFPGGFSDRSWLKRVNLRKAFGKAFTVVDKRTKPPLAINGTTTREKWYYRFTPVAEPVKTERWQVEVRGQDRWSWGMFTGLRAGVDVDWAHRTTLVIKNGRITSAKGKVHIVRVRKFSEPPGAFDVTSVKTETPPEFKLIKAVKRKNSNRVVLELRKRNRSEYLVRFMVAAAGPELLDKLRSIGVADPDASYRGVIARGPVDDSAAPLVPHSSRLVVRLVPGDPGKWQETEEFNKQLPCTKSGATEEDCFLARGGQKVTVTQLK
ncbi:MAG: hypothetical protein R2720_04255 [Candidatus Nanopelagicales bacterium]